VVIDAVLGKQVGKGLAVLRFGGVAKGPQQFLCGHDVCLRDKTKLNRTPPPPPESAQCLAVATAGDRRPGSSSAPCLRPAADGQAQTHASTARRDPARLAGYAR